MAILGNFFNLWVIFRGVEYSTDPQNISPKILLPQSKSFLLDFVNLTKTKENMEDCLTPPKKGLLGGVPSYPTLNRDPSQHDREKKLFSLKKIEKWVVILVSGWSLGPP